jgi:rhodanese-related sulfurtransferase
VPFPTIAKATNFKELSSLLTQGAVKMFHNVATLIHNYKTFDAFVQTFIKLTKGIDSEIVECWRWHAIWIRKVVFNYLNLGGIMSIRKISPTEVFRLQQESGSIDLIDVREQDEFMEVHSALATNYPLSTLLPDSIAKNRDRKAPLYVLCRSGKRSLKAAELLFKNGFETLYNVEGGMMEWEASGLPVVKK